MEKKMAQIRQIPKNKFYQSRDFYYYYYYFQYVAKNVEGF